MAATAAYASNLTAAFLAGFARAVTERSARLPAPGPGVKSMILDAGNGKDGCVMKNPGLHRYGFRFEAGSGERTASPLGCGVTAFSVDDAVGLLRERIFQGGEVPAYSVVEDVDVRTLNAGNVRPNMDEPATRGIWFPMGYR